MAKSNEYLTGLLRRLQELREARGLTAEQVEEQLILGPGWVTRIETGKIVPSLGLTLAVLNVLGADLKDLVGETQLRDTATEFERQISAHEKGRDLVINFAYADYDATYVLKNATLKQFEAVLKTLRDGLASLVTRDETAGEAIKCDSVARAFLKGVKLWPDANPSDVWWFLIYRAYCDPFNHPARFARLHFAQSWKRAAGWALEEVLVRHYGPFLKKHRVNLFIASASVKDEIVRSVDVPDRLEADKIDVVLTGAKNGKNVFFGVVHVKASFAERRTDDVPMSHSLVRAGYCSPLWTMDCKSVPSATPTNRGELGRALDEGADRRSAKRKDIEDDGFFSACFSYNQNTVPTPRNQKTRARVVVCNFRNPDDAFSQFILKEWRRFSAG